MHIAVFWVMRSCVLQLGTGVPTYLHTCLLDFVVLEHRRLQYECNIMMVLNFLTL